MTAFVGPALAVAAAMLLGRAGLTHLRNRADLRHALDAQDLVPARARPTLARALGPIELIAASLTAAALVTAHPFLAVAAAVTVVALGAAFVVLLLTIRRVRPAAPCGCHGNDQTATRASVARAGLVLVGGVAVATGAVNAAASLDPTAAATTLVAGLAIALVADGATDALAGLRPPIEGAHRP